MSPRWIVVAGLLVTLALLPAPAGAEPVQLDAGYGHACAFCPASKNVHCWGANNYGQAADRLTGDALAFSAGDYTNCVLLANGNTACWGYEAVKATYTGGDAIQIAVGYGQACVVTAAHNVLCQGGYLGGVTWHQVYGGGDAEWVVMSSYAACYKTAASPNLTCLGWNVTETAWDVQGAPLPSAGGEYAICVLTAEGNVDCMNNTYGEGGQSAG